MPYRSIRGRLLQADTWILELFLGLYTLVWGLGYANPLTDAFATTSPSNVLLARFPGGELAFGLFVTALGAAELASSVRGRRSARAWTAGIVGLFWLSVAVAVGIPTQWAAAGIPHFLLAFGFHEYCWWRLRRGVR